MPFLDIKLNCAKMNFVQRQMCPVIIVFRLYKLIEFSENYKYFACTKITLEKKKIYIFLFYSKDFFIVYINISLKSPPRKGVRSRRANTVPRYCISLNNLQNLKLLIVLAHAKYFIL